MARPKKTVSLNIFHILKSVVAKKEKVVALALKDAFAKKDMSVYGLSMKALRLLVKVVPQKMILYVYGKLCRNV